MWTPLLTDDGSWTLRSAELGVACHSTAGAWTQACERYAAPCRLAELARERGVVRLLDIGTGLGLNIAAALAALDGCGARLEIATLEAHSDVFAAAFALESWPPNCARWVALAHRALAEALAGRATESAPFADGRGALRLRVGDARETLAEFSGESFDAVFFDPFAPRDDPPLWSDSFLRQVAQRMTRDAVLSTYSASLDVRVALAATGLRVGRGPRVGRKAEGTLASFESPLPALDARVVRRVARRVGNEPRMGSAGPPETN